jgi:hypothetical protein
MERNFINLCKNEEIQASWFANMDFDGDFDGLMRIFDHINIEHIERI